MKVGANPDFPVFVQPESTQHDGAEAALFDGVFRVTLNHFVVVLFVPDVPLPPRGAPAFPGEPITTPARARQSCLLDGPYCIVADDALAGTSRRISAPPPSLLAEVPSVVCFVGRQEFARYVDELERIEDLQYGPAPVTRLRPYRVARYLQWLAASGQLDPTHTAFLGGPRPSPDSGHQ